MTTSNGDMLQPYHSFTIEGQAVGALRLLAELLPRTQSDPSWWKWVVIASHDSLYGFMGLALRRTDGAQLLIPRHERMRYVRWSRERSEGRPILEAEPSRTDGFLNLFEKLQNPDRMNQLIHSRVFVPSEDQDRRVRYLDRLRNDLTHYSDASLSVAVVQLPGVVADIAEVIGWLVNESNNVMLYPFDLVEDVNSILAQIAAFASSMGARFAETSAAPDDPDDTDDGSPRSF